MLGLGLALVVGAAVAAGVVVAERDPSPTASRTTVRPVGAPPTPTPAARVRPPIPRIRVYARGFPAQTKAAIRAINRAQRVIRVRSVHTDRAEIRVARPRLLPPAADGQLLRGATRVYGVSPLVAPAKVVVDPRTPEWELGVVVLHEVLHGLGLNHRGSGRTGCSVMYPNMDMVVARCGGRVPQRLPYRDRVALEKRWRTWRNVPPRAA